MYGHHGSKAAGNMVGRLLSFDLRDREVVVVMIHASDIDRSTSLCADYSPGSLRRR